MATDNKKWYRFEKSGVGSGFGHFAGDVTQLDIDADTAKRLMKEGIILQAEPEEIEAAKAKIEAEKAAMAKGSGPTLDPEKLAMAAEIERLQTQLAAAGKKQ